jgi:hypothetical protein
MDVMSWSTWTPSCSPACLRLLPCEFMNSFLQPVVRKGAEGLQERSIQCRHRQHSQTLKAEGPKSHNSQLSWIGI